MAATVSTLFDTGTLVEAIKPGEPHFWRAARIIASAENHYIVCFSGADQMGYQIDPKFVRLRTRKKSTSTSASASSIPATTVVNDLSSNMLHPTSAAIAVSSSQPRTVESSRFVCGAVVEAIKPGGPHFWRAARVIECFEDRYQVSFSGDKKHYNVALKFVRKRAIKKKSKQTEETTAVVDLTLWSSDSSPEPDGDADSNQLGHYTLLDPYQVAADPYSSNIPSNNVTNTPSDPYAYSQFPTREAFLNHPPFDHRRFNNIQVPLWSNRQNYKSKKHGVARRRVPDSYRTPTTHAPSSNWLKKSIHGYHKMFSPELWPPSDTDEVNRWGGKQETASSEEAVTREPIAVEKIAREQEKLGLDAALARVSIPRKPLPRHARRSQPRMSLGNLSAGKGSANRVGRNRNESVSAPLAVKSIHDLPIAPPPPPPLPTSSKVAALRRPKPAQKPNLEDTVSSSDDDGDIRRGPRLSQRQRELARKRRAERVNDEVAPRKKQQVIGSRFPRRKQVSSGLLAAKSGATSVVRKTKVHTQVSQVVNARGNGRRKGQAKRHAGLSTIAVLTNMDRGVDDDYVRHRKEVAKSVAELEELTNAMSDMQMSGGRNEENTACDCDGRNEQRATTADAALKCHLCKRRTHLMCSGLKRRRILAIMDNDSIREVQQVHAPRAALSTPTHSSLMCVPCADLVVRGRKRLARATARTKEEKIRDSTLTKWTIAVPITPLFYVREMSKWTRNAALRENERQQRASELTKRKKTKGQQQLQQQQEQLTQESKNGMMRNVEDLRSGIVRRTLKSGAASRLTVYD